MSLATVESLAAELGRDLEGLELERAVLLLDDAEALLLRRIPDLLTKAAADEHYARLVRRVERSAAARVLRNPDGYRQENEGGYGYQLDTRAASGFLLILDSEWDELLPERGGAWTVNPYAHTETGGSYDPSRAFQYGWPAPNPDLSVRIM